MSQHYHDRDACPYCKGQGYFQLLLGGTENCPNCAGAGIDPDRAKTAAAGKQ